MIRVIHPGSRSWFFTNPGSRGQKGTGSWIQNRNTGILVPVAWSKIAWADLRVDLLHDLAEVSGGERLDVVGGAVAEIFLVHLMLGQGNLSQGPGSPIFSSSLLFFFKMASFHTCCPSSKQCCRSRDILVRIRIRGSVSLTNGFGFGSGSESCYFRHWPSRWQLKIIFFLKFFCFLIFEATFT